MTRNRIIAFISAGVLTLGVGAGATSALAAGSPPAQPVGSGAAAVLPATAAMQPVAAKQAVKAPVKNAAPVTPTVRHGAKHAVRNQKAVRPASKALNNTTPRKAVTIHSAARMG
jgi:hypothetical protein